MVRERKYYHPDDPRHTQYWKKEKKKVYEGLWGIEFGGYRYMPGRLYFYGNYGTIIDVDEEQNTRKSIRPEIRDIEWERAYMYLEAEGFSGWSEDDEYTSDVWALDLAKYGLPSITEVEKWKEPRRKRYSLLLNSNGKLKKYKTAKSNIRELHKRSLGVPLYWNSTKNISEIGARGGGKSYWYAVGVALYNVITDGSKYYDDAAILNPPKAEVCVGSGAAGKSSDFCKKIEEAMSALKEDPDLGVWGEFGDLDFEPSPFYKEMSGSLEPNNKAKKNLWRNEYKVGHLGSEKKEGSGSYIAHVVYSPNKSDGPQAASGGRYNVVIYEEQGETVLLVKAWGSNESTVRVGKRQFGIQAALGTSGNMESVGPAKEIFTHPRDYNLITFNDDWEETGDIGFFLPAYMTASDFKDEQGNTNYEEALEYYLELRRVAEEAKNPYTLAINKMNNPLVPSDMWQQDKGNIFPVAEAQERERQLLINRNFEKNHTPIQLLWDSSKPRGIDYKIDKSKKPFFEYKYRYDREDLDGPIMIYEFPQEIKGDIPTDMYCFIGHDPYVSDKMDEGDSLGATYIIMNPKYTIDGFSGNCIVASYIGKPWGGRKEYYSNLEKLMAFYGNPTRGLWFEANRGDDCKNYFVNKNKQNLLCLRPQNVHNANIYSSKITQYGYILGAAHARKAELMDKVSEWLLEKTVINGETKTNLERIPDIFLIRQIIAFDLKQGNYDAVMALAGCILGMKEKEKQILDDIENKNKHNPLAFLSQNSRMFRNPDPYRSLIDKFKKEPITKQNVNWHNEWALTSSDYENENP